MSGVVVVIGTGGMGMAIARRCGSGARVLLADVEDKALDVAGSELRNEGYNVEMLRTDVSDEGEVATLAAASVALGSVRSLVHTAGVSPVQAPADRVVAVDLVGTAYVLEAFAGVVAQGGAGVVISSMAGHLAGPLPAEEEAALANAVASDLLELPLVKRAAKGDPGMAYAFAKAAASARVRAAARPWGRRGARINAVSPGVIATTMGRAELEGPSGEFMRLMVAASGAGRLGTPDDVAAVAEFVLSDGASFVTGADILVDGGVVAAVRSGQVNSDASDQRLPPLSVAPGDDHDRALLGEARRDLGAQT